MTHFFFSMSVVFFRTYFYFKVLPLLSNNHVYSCFKPTVSIPKKKQNQKKECEANVNKKSVSNVYVSTFVASLQLPPYPKKKSKSTPLILKKRKKGKIFPTTPPLLLSCQAVG